ncbi:hypothetical protein [Vulcanisaeta distributa]|uniref:hypothetical protein n=1 Tax=Vulcanisaeta distributa TaxID=164451 RepID=UPI000AB47D22|nr:hypothetical protein [Vulcanisaeta distributa]
MMTNPKYKEVEVLDLKDYMAIGYCHIIFSPQELKRKFDFIKEFEIESAESSDNILRVIKLNDGELIYHKNGKIEIKLSKIE